MQLERFFPKSRRLRNATLKRIGEANAIIDEFRAKGFRLTLRQLYYQMVTRNLIPNNLREYKKLGEVVSDGRMAGLIDWDAIEDRGRGLRGGPPWHDNVGEYIASVANGYDIDMWRNQKHRVEVWIEKDALLGVFQPACQRWQISLLSCRGHNSQTIMWRAGKRLASYIEGGQEPVILHFGDHDPSGVHMTEDNENRLEIFSREVVEVRRLALNYDQVKKYKPPVNPVKFTDSRTPAYVSKYGKHCWELDALSPEVIDALVETEVKSLVSMRKWKQSEKERDDAQKPILDVAENWQGAVAGARDTIDKMPRIDATQWVIEP